MTVKYRHEIASPSKIGKFGTGFVKILCRWKGSIYQLLWAELAAYICMYTLISLFYRLVLNDEEKQEFKQLVVYCESFAKGTPLDLVLGFYCSFVAGRWWMQYQSIPWPDTLSMVVTTSLKGQGDEFRKIRRNIVRYANLAINISFAKMSPAAAQRFESLETFVEEGFLTNHEKKLLEMYIHKNDESNASPLPDFWVPLVWASNMVTNAREDGKISVEIEGIILVELRNLHGACGGMLNYDRINVPLVYTQIVTIVVQSYILVTLIGRQWVVDNTDEIDLYVPFVTLLHFLLYMGWLKTAQTLLNPFGEDDDDFEITKFIDRNHRICYSIVDQMHIGQPELSQDKFWDTIPPFSKKEVTVEIGNLSNGNYNIFDQRHIGQPELSQDKFWDTIPSFSKKEVTVERDNLSNRNCNMNISMQINQSTGIKKIEKSIA